MKFIIIFVICYINLIQVIYSLEYRVIPNDDLFEYELDPTVPSAVNYFNHDNFTFELIGDDMAEVSGTVKCVKSLDPKLPLVASIRIQQYVQALWVETPLRLYVPDVCAELLNSERVWYKVTKNFRPCPPNKGMIWSVETQIIDETLRLPRSMPPGLIKVFVLATQGIPGLETVKFGFGIRGELVLIK